jgi:hypothetical protein
MVKLANELMKRNIEFEWKVFTNFITKDECFIFKQPKLDLISEIISCDFAVQLSDTEGFPYFVNECHQYNIPTITTAFPAIYECNKIGVILPFELFKNGTQKEWDNAINNILNYTKTVEYKPKCEIKQWLNEFKGIKKGNSYKPDNSIAFVECIQPFYDIECDIKRKIGKKWETNEQRADELIKKRLIRRL